MKIDWTPVSEGLPEKNGHYIATIEFGIKQRFTVMDTYYNDKWDVWEKMVLAWAEKPEPWKGEGDGMDC